MNKQFRCLRIISTVLFLVLVVHPVFGQANGYTVHLSRNFGYGGGSNIRGTFTISLVGEEEKVRSVTFMVDDEAMATIDEPPFRYRFQTDDYGFGLHRLSAIITLQDGTIQTTPVVQYNFISPQNEREQVITLVGGILGAILVTLLVVGLIQSLLFKGKKKRTHQPGEPREYGLLGGTICPKCGRSFPRHIWGINLVVAKLDRCEHCGKWVMTVRATSVALRLAEGAELEAVPPGIVDHEVQTDERDLLEDTKYFDEL